MASPEALAQVIETSALRYKKSASSYIFKCPRCSKQDKLYIRRSDGRFICFYCATIDGYSGKPEIALADLLELPVAEVKKRLYGYSEYSGGGTTLLKLNLKDFYADPEENNQLSPTLEQQSFPFDFYPIDHKFSINGLTYLNNRGITLNIAKFYGLRYNPTKRRVIFPVVIDGVLCGWQARAIDSTANVKILSSKDMKRDSAVMFYDSLKNSQHCIITEGPVDAIKCHMCSGAVATMGKIVGKQQVELIKRSGIKKVYIALDPNAPREMEKLAKEFHGYETYLMQPPSHREDLGDCTFEEVYNQWLCAERINSAHLFVYFKKPY